MSSPQPIPYPLRIPEELRKLLTERARTHNRSLNAEILGILQDAMDAQSSGSNIDVERLAEGLADRLADSLAERIAAKLKVST